MAFKLGDQIHQSKPDSLEHLLLVKILDVFLTANGRMHDELEKLRESGEDKTIYSKDGLKKTSRIW
ncbi:hypothetical protein [Stutzerimonas nitrititolerans]|uniref:hypothetical protein n=1 Tax=Stutzerimonas nitrititolerans TaxID=2482751 RepID=UPI0028A8B9E7|nr:hypothetical protein [Stutzerimonas nitrititolerans]